MRGRRHKLQVSTFPFLAVLLCAMGSLILVLLVMDRKAHQAAQNRARREAARLAEQTAQSEAELEQKRQEARRAWEQKREALHTSLTREQIELHLQMKKVRDQLSAIATRLRYEQDTSINLRRNIQTERGRIESEQKALASLRTTAEQTASQSKESSKTLQRMTTDLLQMEQALKDLKAARQREQHTFSVVPYHGRRGEDRRPIYVECTARGVIFHPDRRAMPVTSREFLVGQDRPMNDVPDDVHGEVERRIARQRAKMAGAPGAASATPYLLLLVRPDGIDTYCQLQAVLKDMTLDFGYEFIDADWVLDFPTEDGQPSAQPWMTAARTPAPAAPTSSPETDKSARPVGMTPSRSPIAISGNVAQGFRTGEGPGSGGWPGNSTGRAGGVSPLMAGSSATGRAGGVSPLFAQQQRADAPRSPPVGVSFLGAGGGVPGAGGESSPVGIRGLVGGLSGNRTSQGIGVIPDPLGQGNGRGSATGGNSTGIARGHPAALQPAMPGNSGEAGMPDLGGPRSAHAPGSPILGGTSPEGRTLIARGNGGEGPGQLGRGSGGDSTGGPPGKPGATGNSTGGPRGGVGGTGQSGAAGPSVGGPPGTPGNGNERSTAGTGPGDTTQASPGQPRTLADGAHGASESAAGDGSAAPPVDPLAPKAPSGSQPGDPSAKRSPNDVPSDGAPRRRPIGGGGGSGEPGDPASAPLARFAPPAAPAASRRKPVALRPAWVHGGRDWIIYVECLPDGVVLYPARKRFSLAQAASQPAGNPLVAAIKQMIERRQSARRPGEPPYYPQVRLLVRPEHVRTFHLVYPALEALPAPKTRQNLEPEDDVAAIVTGANP